jgi:hypothetical protein
MSPERFHGDDWPVVKAGDVIENPVTGEIMTFLLTGTETEGELLRIDMGVRPGGFAASEHVHPHQEELLQLAVTLARTATSFTGRSHQWRSSGFCSPCSSRLGGCSATGRTFRISLTAGRRFQVSGVV